MPNSFTSVVETRDDNKNKIETSNRNFDRNESAEDSGSTTIFPDIENENHQEAIKIYKLGEKGSGIRLQGEIQDFDKLREKCLSEGKLFQDPEFPAHDSSIFVQQERPEKYLKEIEWRRPKEIVDNPQLFVDGPSRFDVIQGIHSNNCWMVSSLAILAMHKNLLYQILPEDQGFEDKYAGIFRVRFWQFGKWVEVVIDDRLPIYDGKILFLHSVTNNEFWSSIIEKAYAKLHGFWEALEFGYNAEAFEDFTGGISQLYRIENSPSDLFEIILEAQKRNSLIGCIVNRKDEEYRKGLGLVLAHAYSVTKVVNLFIKRDNDREEKISLLRVRNPWGKREWRGAWSDLSPEWNFVSDDIKEEIDYRSKNEGEFWIEFNDWKKNFDVLEICYLNINYFLTKNYKNSNKNWETYSFDGEWVRGSSSGGSRKELKNYQHNPQYRLNLEEESTMIVSLMQKNRRTQRQGVGSKFISIGFDIYKLKEESEIQLTRPLDVNFFRDNEPLLIESLMDPDFMTQTIRYFDYRQASCRIKLPPGSYFVIPSTEIFGQEGEFLLRLFSEKKINMEEYDEEIGEVENLVEIEDSDENENEVKSRSIFRKLAGNDWEFNWREHKEIMDYKLARELSEEGFSEESCRSMVALLDGDDSGKIGYKEFKIFLKNVKKFKAAFKDCDEGGFGYLEPLELRRALKKAGFRMNNQILNLLVRRYGTENGYIKFDDFFMCAIRIKKMFDNFKERVSPETNEATFTIKEWIETTLKS